MPSYYLNSKATMVIASFIFLLVMPCYPMVQMAFIESSSAYRFSERDPKRVFNAYLKVHHNSNGSLCIPYRTVCYLIEHLKKTKVPSMFQHEENPSYLNKCDIFSEWLTCPATPRKPLDKVKVVRLACSRIKRTSLGRECQGCIVVFGSGVVGICTNWTLLLITTFLVTVVLPMKIA
ncbi:uncharacterized protein LOC111245214 [Varroa destructor]|uniref:Uncharacterized protein n=1 Tax=Varroa destructor TaxID=109461 RepID=A0A7M7JA66_VARDE|nr:uncharacterized protein LOC111245214 [Varroa destructor]XP_022648986.1 uncharacterized protein LOC111245214 [Varroa destructor]